MKPKILVIDDEAEICSMLNDFLTKEGYDVVTTTSAMDGIDKVVTEKPQVICLDIRMPEMNGIEVMEQIRRIDKEVTILMATAVMDDAISAEAAKLGAYDYVIKPFDLNYLKKILQVKTATME
ncbi:MAG: response regulator [Candidatus Omnitrophica bacterium]|nr:response regulator [Candidatus Omnitrophota bacterium]